MANSKVNIEKLKLAIIERQEGIKNLEFQVGTTLARNVKAEARKSFGEGKSGYPYEFHNSFQSDKVVFYDESQHAVIVDHPAANVLEWGIGQQTIKAKDAEFMHFTGKDGQEVYAKEVVIAPKKPVGYARAAIEETKKDLVNIYKDGIKFVEG